jgi:hypothetical protein
MARHQTHAPRIGSVDINNELNALVRDAGITRREAAAAVTVAHGETFRDHQQGAQAVINAIQNRIANPAGYGRFGATIEGQAGWRATATHDAGQQFNGFSRNAFNQLNSTGQARNTTPQAIARVLAGVRAALVDHRNLIGNRTDFVSGLRHSQNRAYENSVTSAPDHMNVGGNIFSTRGYNRSTFPNAHDDAVVGAQPHNAVTVPDGPHAPRPGQIRPPVVEPQRPNQHWVPLDPNTVVPQQRRRPARRCRCSQIIQRYRRH